MKILFLFAVSIIFLSGCQPDKEIIKGSISGFIRTFDQSSVPVEDQSGVTVNLYKDTALLESQYTDPEGKYTFETVPYGTYRIDPAKDGYVSVWDPSLVHHIGGYSPTLANYQLYEIPTYVLTIDSITYDTVNDYILFYVKFNGDTLLPPSVYGYILRAFAGPGQDVNMDNYAAAGKAYLLDTEYHIYPKKMRAYARMNTWELENVSILRTGTFYMRLYPLAMGQGYWIHDYLPEALGPPSVNAFEFNYTDLVENR